MSSPNSSTWTIESFQTMFKDVYDAVVSAAKAKITETVSKRIPDISTVVLPWDDAKIDMHFEDPESGQSGTVCALKILDIPLERFKPVIDDKITSDDGFIAAVMNIFINPIVNACKDALASKKDENTRLYVKYGTTPDSSVKVFLIYNGEVADESTSIHFESAEFDGFNFNETELDITEEECNDITTEAVIENFMLELKGAKRRESPNDFINILKKAGIEKNIGMYVKEYVKWGWGPLTSSMYNTLKRTADIDREFKNYKEDIVNGTKTVGKNQHTYQTAVFNNHACILGTIKKIVDDKAPTFSLEGVWLLLYNKRKNKIIHKRVAKAAAYEKIVKTEGLFGFGDKFDYGIACDPSIVKQNRFTFGITPRTGEVILKLDRSCEDFEAMLTPFLSHGIEANVRSIYQKFQLLSPDWDVLTDAAILTKHKEDTAKMIFTKFKSVDVFGRWTHQSTGEKGVDCYQYWMTRWLYNVVFIIELWSIRPEGYEDIDRYNTQITNIYAIMHNSVTDQFATPLIASVGWNFKPNIAPANADSPISDKFISSKRTTMIKDIDAKKAIHLHTMKKSLASKYLNPIKEVLNATIDATTESSVIGEFELADVFAAQKKLQSFLRVEGRSIGSEIRYPQVTKGISAESVVIANIDSSKNQIANVFSPKVKTESVTPQFTETLNAVLAIIADESGSITSFDVDTSNGIRILAHFKQ